MWKNCGATLIVSLALALTACSPGSPVKPAERPADGVVGNAADEAQAQLRFNEAMKLVADRNWPAAGQSFQAIIGDSSFSRLSLDLRHKVLVVAGETALVHGSPLVAYDDFDQATSIPNAGIHAWEGKLSAAEKSGNTAGSISTLTAIVQRWPARALQFPPRYLLRIVNQATKSSPDAALPLLQGLYDAHWKLKWDIEPSAAWRDLTLRLLDAGRLAQAVDVSLHITDPSVLISMRADRRFDAVVAANRAHFDVVAAAQREFQAFQGASERTPDSLELQNHVIEALLRQQRYQAALAACDSVLATIHSTNYPENLYTDYRDQYNWLLDERADLLLRVERWDEAVAQLSAASRQSEDGVGNVSQLINLAHLYVDLDRPQEALATLGSITGPISPFGTMQLEKVRLNAANQLADSQQVGRSMQYLEAHRLDEPDAYEDALIYVNQLDRAAQWLQERLADPGLRADALADVQRYAAPPRTPRQVEYQARWNAILARADVQQALQRVGRIEEYTLEQR